MATTEDPGPFSSLFDYKDEEKKLEERKKQLDLAQQRIARTNVLGEVFRVLSDAVGGSRGADIVPRPVNPGIASAVEKYHALDQDTEAERRRLRAVQLGLASKDKGEQLQDQKQKEAIQAGYNMQLLKGRMASDLQANQFAQQKELQGEKGAQAEKVAGIHGQTARDVQALKNKGFLDVTKEKNQRTAALAQKGLFEVARYDDPNNNTIVSREKVLSVLPELKNYLRSQGLYPTQMPKVLQMSIKNGKIADDDLKYLIGAYRDFFEPRFPELIGGSSNGPYTEPTDKDVFQMLLNEWNGNQSLGPEYTGPYTGTQPEQELEPVQPVTDFSSFFN